MVLECNNGAHVCYLEQVNLGRFLSCEAKITRGGNDVDSSIHRCLLYLCFDYYSDERLSTNQNKNLLVTPMEYKVFAQV